MKLLITLLLAALCAGFSPNKHVAFSCSLAAAVNLIAVVHYAFIWAIRAQVLPEAYKRFAAKPRGAYTPLGEGGDGPEPWEADDKRNLLVQEFAVDALLRHSDLFPSLARDTPLLAVAHDLGQYVFCASNAASPSPVARVFARSSSSPGLVVRQPPRV